MTLREYLKALPRNERSDALEAVAMACGVTRSAVKHWVTGARNIPAGKAAKVVKLLGGAVSMEDLIPELKTLESSDEPEAKGPGPAKGFWLVWRESGSAPTKKHPSFESAVTEAERLSKKYIGENFYVLAPVDCVSSMAATIRWASVKKIEED